MTLRLSSWLIMAHLFGVCALSVAQEQARTDSIPQGIILFGATTIEKPNESTIQVVSDNTGEKIRTLHRLSVGTVTFGRLSRQQNRIAFSKSLPDGKDELWLLDSECNSSKIADGGSSTITAWSPDGKQVAFYQVVPGMRSFESYVVDVASMKVKKLELPPEYVAEDWHPRSEVRTAIYMNSRNLLYREQKGDHYPTRQLDLVTASGQRTPLTKIPSTDNIWSRFSPAGDRIAHYQRRLVGEKSYESAIVCNEDGTNPREVLGFTEIGDAEGLPWFRPNGMPAWSPDGTTLAWLVSANSMVGDEGRDLQLVFTGANGKHFRRISLTKLGYGWVSAIDWR